MARQALIGWAMWCVTVFALRDWIHRRRTGKSGVMPSARGLDARGYFAGALFVVAMPLVPLAAWLELRGVLAPLWDTSRRPAEVAAAVLFGVGWLGTFLCQLALGDSWRVGLDRRQRTSLVTGGPYQLARNPIYTFVIVSAASLVAAVPNAVSIAAFALLFAGLDLWVRWIEEPFLAAQHGDAYRAYAARVGRFVPGLGRLRTRPRV